MKFIDGSAVPCIRCGGERVRVPGTLYCRACQDQMTASQPPIEDVAAAASALSSAERAQELQPSYRAWQAWRDAGKDAFCCEVHERAAFLDGYHAGVADALRKP